MFQEFYRGSDLLHLPLYALVFFVAVFLGVVAWVWVFGRRDERFDQLARIPFEPSGENTDE